MWFIYLFIYYEAKRVVQKNNKMKNDEKESKNLLSTVIWRIDANRCRPITDKIACQLAQSKTRVDRASRQCWSREILSRLEELNLLLQLVSSIEYCSGKRESREEFYTCKCQRNKEMSLLLSNIEEALRIHSQPKVWYNQNFSTSRYSENLKKNQLY